MTLNYTPAPYNGPCIYRKYDNVFCDYYCNLTYQKLPEEGCSCEYERIKYVIYK